MYKSKKKILWSILGLFLAVLFSLTGAWALSFYHNFHHKTITNNDRELGISSDDSKDVTNVALFGVDSRSNKFEGNSDSLMIISIDKKNCKVKLTSILRDSLVKVGDGLTKIDEAYGHGGAVLAINTLNTNYHMNIRNYATINFGGMAEVINTIGGVTINVDKSEINMLNGLAQQQAKELNQKAPPLVTHPGEQVLNGMQAVAYSRIRKVDNPDGSFGDYGRTDRQRTVMEQLFNKALQMKKSQYPEFVNAVLPYMETSLSIGEILDLAGILTRDNVAFEQTRIPQLEYTINPGYNYKGKSTVYYNLDFASDILHAFIYDDIPQEEYLKTHDIPTEGSFTDILGTAAGSLDSTSGDSSHSSTKQTRSKPQKTASE